MDSPSTERDDPSRVSEDADAILDSLFNDCDTERTGRVSVSRLIEYLRNAISNGTEEFAGNLDDLSLIWDPDGRDLEIDLTSFQEGIKEWISDIRQRSFVTVEDDGCPSPSYVNCMDSPEPRTSYNSPKKISDHVSSTPNVSSDSVEGVGGVSPDRDWDRSTELISTIENLQLNNKRLLEQHTAMQTQMESTEEANSQLSAEVEGLQKQLRSYHLLMDKSKEKDKEITELRQAVSDALDANQCLQGKISQLEKERALYESNINGIGEKLLEAQTQIELLEDERTRLINDLAEQKQYCSDLQEIQGVKNDMIAKESSTNSSMIAGLASENETLKMEKGRLENRILDLEENVVRLKKNELSAERSQLFQNGPSLTSTPFSRQSSLQQELEAQETYETKGLPSPMVGSLFNFNDSLDGDVLDTSLTGLNQSWMSSLSFDSTSTNATFEKYSLTALQLASEFKEKKERALRQIDELALLDKSGEVKDKKEVLREQLTQDLDNFATRVSSLCIKKKAAEKRAMKLLAASKKLKEENKQLFDERSKAYQKLGTMSLCNDEMSARMLELESRLEQERKTVEQQSEELRFLEQQAFPFEFKFSYLKAANRDILRNVTNEKLRQLSAVTEDLFKMRDEKENLSRSLEYEKRLSSSLEEEIVTLRKSQDELESQQTLLLVKIKELESELLKTTSQLGVEKRRTSTLEESIQLSVSRHSDELKEIFDAIPLSDVEVLNRSRQSPRASSPCITGHMVKTKLFEFVSQCDTNKRIQGVGRDSPDGKPVNELEENEYQEVSKSQQREELTQTPLERWLDNDFYKQAPSSISSDSLSPNNGRQEVDGISESPSGKFLQLVEAEYRTSGSQTDLKDFASIGSQTDLLSEIEEIDLKEFLSEGSQTDLLREIEDIDFKELVSTGSQTDLLNDIEELLLDDKETITDDGDRRERRRKSAISETPVIVTETIKLGDKHDSAVKPTSEESGSGSTNLSVEKEKTATKLWRKKLSVAFKTPDEFDSYESATGRALENAVGTSNFVDGVSLRVSPAPNEKEIEKQFKTLVLAFHTDQDTLSKRLEVQARARDIAESNMNKELQSMANLLKEFDHFCITRDMQDMLSVLKSQVEVMKTSTKRLTTQTEQHGCVQQEARMSSGIEVMICHAENVSRHLERVREDLTELRLKERLVAEEPVTSVVGSSFSDSTLSKSASSSPTLPDQPVSGTDGTKQNSLLNFVMAFHTTSMRAKEAIRSFRRRSGAGKQERVASAAVPRVETDDAVAASDPVAERDQDGQSNSWPEISVVNSEGKEDGSTLNETGVGDGTVVKNEEEVTSDPRERVSDEAEESSENISEVEELESGEGSSSERSSSPSIYRRFFSAAFRFTISLIILVVIVFVGLAIMDRHTSFKIDMYFPLSKVRKVLEPVGELIYYIKPPE